MADALLILNAGSSSLKFSLFAEPAAPRLLMRGALESLTTAAHFRAVDAAGRSIGEQRWTQPLAHSEAVEFILGWLGRHRDDVRVVATGHRVVHGGMTFDRPVIVDDATLRELEALTPLAPLHQPHNLAAIRAVARHDRSVPQVACFDTAFHRVQPELAQLEAIPRSLTARGVRRYGFHGLSYEFIAGALPALDAKAASGRTIVAHLGNGASLCAMRGGRSVATTMGFTAIDGLVMGTRCGTIDPGVLLYLEQHEGRSADDVAHLLYEESGLLGVSEISSDMRTLLASDDPRAKQAIDLFIYRAAREIGSLAAALGGLDALVFTGGIGEHAERIRAEILRASAWLGIELDVEANARGGPRLSRDGSRTTAWVVATDEELMIARHSARLLAARFAAERSQ